MVLVVLLMLQEYSYYAKSKSYPIAEWVIFSYYHPNYSINPCVQISSYSLQ